MCVVFVNKNISKVVELRVSGLQANKNPDISVTRLKAYSGEVVPKVKPGVGPTTGLWRREYKAAASAKC